MLPARFTEYIGLIDRYLDRSIAPDEAPPAPIYEAMRYSLFAGGKRLRPMLCLAAAESLEGDAQALLPVACAIEMVHTYSLIHDDLPSMDNDDFRRGKPTNHKVFGEAIAILAGDALLTAGLGSIAAAFYDPALCCRLLWLLSDAIGPAGMIGGQVLDIMSERKQLSGVELERMHGMKTAALISFSAVAPAIVLQSGPSAESALRRYGESIGLAFQIVDDILDVEGRSEDLGKTAGKDKDSQKATYPALFGLEESRTLAEDLISSAVQAVASIDRHSYLTDLAHYVLERKK